MRHRALALTAAAVLLAALAAGPAGAATLFGQTVDPSSGCNAGWTWMAKSSPGNVYAAPSPGVITAWSFQAGALPPSLKLKVGRPGGGNIYTVVGESTVQSPPPSQVTTFTDVRIPVQTGDVLGFFIATSRDCAGSPGAGYQTNSIQADVPVGVPTDFGPPGNGFQIDISAMLEPDADGDGFGDETQDECPADPSKQECTPPQTTFTRQPKDKTKKKQASFEFTASEPGSSFNCTLDGKEQFKPCTSPLTIKVKRGKHTFSVTATDAAGNADPTPATDNWKVKKRK